MGRVILLLALFAASASVCARGNFTAYGIDSASCGKYIQDTASSPAASNTYTLWLAGFVSGTNLHKSRSTYIDLEGLTVWVTSYCQRNPLETFMHAAAELDKELDRRYVRNPQAK